MNTKKSAELKVLLDDCKSLIQQIKTDENIRMESTVDVGSQDMLRSGVLTVKNLENEDPIKRRFALDALALYHLEEFGLSAVRPLESMLDDPEDGLRLGACYLLSCVYEYYHNHHEEKDRLKTKLAYICSEATGQLDLRSAAYLLLCRLSFSTDIVLPPSISTDAFDWDLIRANMREN